MTTVYKHLARMDAESMARGEIRIGSFAYFHGDEHPATIRDEKEGITVGRTKEVVLTTQSSEPVETIIAGLKFVTQSGGVINASNMTFIRTLPPLYIYCTTFIRDVGHFKERDTVVKINDIEEFGRILVDGKRDLLNGYWSNRVRYEPRVYDALNHQGIDPDPFIKDKEFSPDEEFRLVFMPAGTVEPYVTFRLDTIRQAFEDGLCELVQ